MIFFLPLASPSVLFIQNQSGTSKLCTLSMLATAVVVVMHVVSLYYYSTLSDSFMYVRGRVTSVELRLQSFLRLSLESTILLREKALQW